jgi:hypothetical protein
VLAYFRQVYSHRVEQTPNGVELVKLTDEELLIEALHLAYSRDGTHWTALNNNRPILSVSPTFPGLRDPFLQRGRDGAFHLVGTGGSERRDILYSRSPDLIAWEPPRSLPVMRAIPEAKNAWAPEFLYDPAQDNYLVYWSSSRGRYGWDDSRIWCARTSDFSQFSAPRLLFDPGFTVIDATIVPLDDVFYMFFKDERFGHPHGEHRAIRVALGAHLEGPYQIQTEHITPIITEGPAVQPLPNSDRWLLLYDYCMDNRYGASISTDLLHWDMVENAAFPPNARHGSICAVSEEELTGLLQAFGPADSASP